MSNRKGRPKGAKNLKTVEAELFRERFHQYCYTEGGFERFMIELQKLKGEAYCKNFLASLEFMEPKLQRTELANADKKPFIINLMKFGKEAMATLKPQNGANNPPQLPSSDVSGSDLAGNG